MVYSAPTLWDLVILITGWMSAATRQHRIPCRGMCNQDPHQILEPGQMRTIPGLKVSNKEYVVFTCIFIKKKQENMKNRYSRIRIIRHPKGPKNLTNMPE